MKKIVILLNLIFLFSCNQATKNTEIKSQEKQVHYSIQERLEKLKMKCIEDGDAEAFGRLVDHYANTPSNYYELFPISIIMANKYNNDNARVTIYFQMIMMMNDGKRDDKLFFTLKEAEKEFIVAHLVDGLKNNNPGCKGLLKKILAGGYKIKNANPEIENLIN